MLFFICIVFVVILLVCFLVVRGSLPEQSGDGCAFVVEGAAAPDAEGGGVSVAGGGGV